MAVLTDSPRVVPIGLALLVVYALITVQHVEDFRSDLALWSAAVKVTPERPRVQINYGAQLVLAQRFTEAEQTFAYARALTTKDRVRPDEYPRLRSVSAQNLAVLIQLRAPTDPAAQREVAALFAEAYAVWPEGFTPPKTESIRSTQEIIEGPR